MMSSKSSDLHFRECSQAVTLRSRKCPFGKMVI